MLQRRANMSVIVGNGKAEVKENKAEKPSKAEKAKK